jgi:hypothetical protein
VRAPPVFRHAGSLSGAHALKMFRGKDVEEINELKREGLSIRAIIGEAAGYTTDQS